MFGLLLKIIHAILIVINLTCDAICATKKKFLILINNWDRRQFVNEMKDLKKLGKMPVHLTILLGKDEEPSLKDLSNMVLWSLFTGITFISFYDSNGTLSKAEDKFQNVVNELKCDDTAHIIWHSNHNFKHKNGHTGNKIHVKIYTEKDGRFSVAQLIQKLARGSNIHEDVDKTNVNANQLNVNVDKRDINMDKMDISIDKIDKLLSVNYEFPDPDMGLYFGNSFFLNGYPPWQLRVTEFFNIKSYRNMNFKTFINLMCKYSKCDQRLGK